MFFSKIIHWSDVCDLYTCNTLLTAEHQVGELHEHLVAIVKQGYHILRSKSCQEICANICSNILIRSRMNFLKKQRKLTMDMLHDDDERHGV